MAAMFTPARYGDRARLCIDAVFSHLSDSLERVALRQGDDRDGIPVIADLEFAARFLAVFGRCRCHGRVMLPQVRARSPAVSEMRLEPAIPRPTDACRPQSQASLTRDRLTACDRRQRQWRRMSLTCLVLSTVLTSLPKVADSSHGCFNAISGSTLVAFRAGM